MVRYIGKFCVVLLLALPVYLVLRRPWARAAGEKRGVLREWIVGAFILFHTGLLALVMEGEYGSPAQMAACAAERLASGEGVNLVPFRSIGSFFERSVPEIFLINIVGNIVMFVPWGFGLNLLWKRFRSGLVVAVCLIFPLLIETCQLFIGRSMDVDDLILNFMGGCLGAGLSCLLRRRFPGSGRLAR